MTISAHRLAATPAKLAYRARVPLFYLPSASEPGEKSGPAATRSKYNLVLAFVESSSDGEAYIRALCEIYSDVLERVGRVIAVIPRPLNEARALKTRLNLPFTLLADERADTTRRLLGDDALSALCVADRYGVVYFLEKAVAASQLPPARTALEWLDFVEIQCPE